jgi:hypothetical protein
MAEKKQKKTRKKTRKRLLREQNTRGGLEDPFSILFFLPFLSVNARSYSVTLRPYVYRDPRRARQGDNAAYVREKGRGMKNADA